MRGSCLAHTRVHGYEPDDQYGLNMDTAYLSCTNGFTCGNIVAPAAEVADFVFALYGERGSVLSAQSVREMKTIWRWYGLGTMDLPSYGLNDGRYCRFGHFGVTYGFTANAAYSPAFNFSLVWGTNLEDPGQTATHGASYDFLMQFDCELFAAVVGVLHGAKEREAFNCSWSAVNASQAGVCAGAK